MKIMSKYVYLFLTLVIFNGCGSNKIENSNFEVNSKYEQQLKDLEKGMVSYMKWSQPNYTQSEVDQCIDILKEYLHKIPKSKSHDEGMEIVKSTVLALNKLNQKCDTQLIETGQRDQIANIIISAATDKGYTTMDGDITEEWREW